ncbi:MAG: DEAD/DEAH box helicase [Candidatus Diapherotrites archaeon]|uniref:ATP-dependent DNA helicase Hel308 n=1 Tax=Candidatus Iainarchaeum sp. TaxID=3101447 RepID=A0A7J4IUD6_9ARCH|nr:MAG: helicase [archaeon GW2011_AR10]MBS3058930.1 DEAD/DEAH box helicase [Candidatus Diapherotrites archaeon]HIH08404.1 DEAD/DEAH box helicase [Candidatus Diapherotrites archaeon]
MGIEEIVKNANGFSDFNPMQQKALKKDLFNKSIVVSSPTASGKTILAELSALNSILNNRKKVVYTCPLRALASEHFNDFKKKYSASLQIRAAISIGDFDSSSSYLKNYDIIYSTYEKLESLIRHRADWLQGIGVLIVDEIHSLGTDRGSTLEMVITKLRFFNKNLQVLGLSATIPNSKEIASWLNADLVESDFRPVKLVEGVFLEGTIDFGKRKEKIESKSDDIEALAADTLARGKQALIFANTRKRSEGIAKRLASLTSRQLTESEKKELEKASEKALNVLEQPTEQCRSIAALIKNGVCFHNAGLMQKQREVIEELFKKNHLKFISSTTTLAAGINLPAYRVVIPSPYRYSGFGMEKLPVSEFKQMCGRAGRPAFDSEGEAILIAKTDFEKDDYFDYFINGKIENIDSRLGIESNLRFHLLAAISSGFIFDLDSAEKFFSATFYAKQFGNLSELFRKITTILQELEEMGFVHSSEKRIDVTPIGRRVVELYLDPVSAYEITEGLRKNKFNDLSYLFLISNTSEFYPLLSVSRSRQAELWERLQQEKHLLPINVELEMFSDYNLLSKYHTSLMLKDWIGEVSEQNLVDSFNVQPGILHAKMQRADWLAYAAFELAKLLELKEHLPRLNKMRKRLKSGIKEELIYLCEVRGIGRVRARKLFNAGIKSIAELKKVDLLDLQRLLPPKVALNVKKQIT